ncbi:MAG: diacylglycerol kinase family protein [Actinomycetes bacterium]
MRAAVIVNPTKFTDLDLAQSRLDVAVRQLGFEPPTWITTTADRPGTDQARDVLAEGVDLILVWGGDGTVNAVADAMISGGVPLGLLPGGTGNLLARNLGVPLYLSGAVRTAYLGLDHAIDTLAVSLGQGVVRTSLVMVGTGWDAAMMDVNETLKQRIGWAAYAFEGAKQFREHPLRMRISVDGSPPTRYYGRTCLVANVGTLVAGLQLVPEAKVDDGLLDVLVLDPTRPAAWARTTWTLARGKSPGNAASRTLLQGHEVVVSTHAARPRQIDGDLVEPGHGFRVKVRPRSLVVRVPQHPSGRKTPR